MAVTKKQLEAQLAALQKENENLKKQIDARVEDADSYKVLQRQIANEVSKKEAYKRQSKNWEKQYFDLQAKIKQNIYTLQDAEETAEEQDLEDFNCIIEDIKEAYANRHTSISDAEAVAIVKIWSRATDHKEALGNLSSYITDLECAITELKEQLQEQDEKIQKLEQQIADKEATNQYNSNSGNYTAILNLNQKLKEKQAELDAAQTAQNALKSDYDNKCSELQELRQDLSKSQKNPFGAGRKPKLNIEQIEKVKELSAQGLSIRKIALEMDCSASLICKVLNNVDK